MSYCVKCGQFIENEEEGCPNCKEQSVQPVVENFIKPQPIEGNTMRPQPNNVGNGLKVTIVALTLLIPLLGYIFGVIMSIYYLNVPNQDTRSYGKALLILCITMVSISVLCCVAFYALGFVAAMQEVSPYIGNGYKI